MVKPLFFALVGVLVGAFAAHAIQESFLAERGEPQVWVTALAATLLGLLGYQRGRLPSGAG
ncbi:MAG: hypothetical protein WD226_03615 [Planctomycetota bacterium]